MEGKSSALTEKKHNILTKKLVFCAQAKLCLCVFLSRGPAIPSPALRKVCLEIALTRKPARVFSSYGLLLRPSSVCRLSRHAEEDIPTWCDSWGNIWKKAQLTQECLREKLAETHLCDKRLLLTSLQALLEEESFIREGRLWRTVMCLGQRSSIENSRGLTTWLSGARSC